MALASSQADGIPGGAAHAGNFDPAATQRGLFYPGCSSSWKMCSAVMPAIVALNTWERRAK